MAEATGRTAVVTGAASGIGFAVADRLLREGARVVAVDRERRGMQPLVDRGADAVEGDLTVDADRDRVVAAGQGAHYLVNAAGIIRLKPIWDITITDLREVYAVNVEATWDLCSRIGRTIPAAARS
jgi:NAD(P)-dependent dehydrogenase (short-subunit alcohol dehydrogenase family)